MKYIESLLLEEKEDWLEKINHEINRINDLMIEYRSIINDIIKNDLRYEYQLEKYRDKIKEKEEFLKKCIEIKKIILGTID